MSDECNIRLMEEVAGLSGVVDVAAGRYHSLALTSTGDVYGWGSNGWGQINRASYGNFDTPALIMSGVSAIAAGDEYSLFIKDGDLWACGNNDQGYLGDGSQTYRLSPVRCTIGKSFVQVAASYITSGALDSSGDLWLWGYYAYRDGIYSTGAQSDVPVKITSDGGRLDLDIALQMIYQVLSDNSIIGDDWGTEYGSLRITGDTSQTWGALAAGRNDQLLCLTTSGALYQLGGTAGSTPTVIPGGMTFIDISAGRATSAGVDDSNVCWQWGVDIPGGLDEITSIKDSDSNDVPLVKISSFYDHTLGIDTDGVVWGWGDNTTLQLGPATTPFALTTAYRVNPPA